MNCLFSANIQRSALSNYEWKWHVIFNYYDHNHKNKALLCHLTAPKLLANERKTAKALTEVAATPKVIPAASRQNNPDRPLIPRYIYIERAQFRSIRLEECTPI